MITFNSFVVITFITWQGENLVDHISEIPWFYLKTGWWSKGQEPLGELVELVDVAELNLKSPEDDFDQEADTISRGDNLKHKDKNEYLDIFLYL